jgi:hypothetical protein
VNRPLPGATELDNGSALAYLTAHFCIARLVTKRISASPDQAMRDVREAIVRLRWIVHNAPRIRAAPQDFEQEISIANEMAALLPVKIQQLRALQARLARK